MSDQPGWTLDEVEAAVRRRSPHAAEAVEWFWSNGHFVDKYGAFIRRARGWCKEPEIRSVFQRLRPPTPMRHDGRFASLMDWIALSDALGLEAEVLDWFDQRIAASDLPIPPMSGLRALVLHRGRLRDLLAFSEPLDATVGLLEGVGAVHEILGGVPELVSWELEQIDCEVALWRRVAEQERPEQLSDIDAVIDSSARAASIRSLQTKPPADLAEVLTKLSSD